MFHICDLQIFKRVLSQSKYNQWASQAVACAAHWNVWVILMATSYCEYPSITSKSGWFVLAFALVVYILVESSHAGKTYFHIPNSSHICTLSVQTLYGKILETPFKWTITENHWSVSSSKRPLALAITAFRIREILFMLNHAVWKNKEKYDSLDRKVLPMMSH